jgi:hypothetical protein
MHRRYYRKDAAKFIGMKIVYAFLPMVSSYISNNEKIKIHEWPWTKETLAKRSRNLPPISQRRHGSDSIHPGKSGFPNRAVAERSNKKLREPVNLE